MASTRDRQRALARAKLERQMARRAAAARRRRQIQAGVASVAALALVAVGAWWLIDKYGGSDTPEANEAPCTYTELPEGERQPADKDVGLPSTTDMPTSGVRTMSITTSQGIIEIELDVTKAPCIANSFAHLAGKKFYDNTSCHRMTTQGSSMLQCGDPQQKPDGTGGPTYKFNDENLPTTTPAYPRGTVAMANSGPGTNGSQFFLVFKDSEFDGPKYSVAGRVTKGLEILDKIAAGGVVDANGKPSTTGEGAPKTPVKITTVVVGPVQPASPTPAPTTPPPSTPPSSPAPSGSQSAKS